MEKLKLPQILKNHQFLRLWGNQILLQLGLNMCNYTALLILANRTHSPFIQAEFYTMLTIPAFAFGLIAGPIVDMTDRKRLMLITDALMAVLLFCYSFTGGNVLAILWIAFLASSIARFFIPAEAATIPLIVSEETLEHANSFFLFTLLGSVLFGYAIAGPMIQFAGGLGTPGENMPFYFSAVLLIIGFCLRLSLKKIVGLKPDVPKGSLFTKTLKLFWETVCEVKSNIYISFSLILLIFVELMTGLLSILVLEYVHRYLALPLTSVSYILMVPLIFGLVVGMAFLKKIEITYGHRKSIFAALLISGVAMTALGLTPIIFGHARLVLTFLRIAAIIISFVVGILVVVVAVQARTMLQTNAKSHMHGRIFSFLDVMIACVTPIPVLLLGLLADKVSLLATLVFIGIAIIIVTFIGKILAVKYSS